MAQKTNWLNISIQVIIVKDRFNKWPPQNKNSTFLFSLQFVISRLDYKFNTFLVYIVFHNNLCLVFSI